MTCDNFALSQNECELVTDASTQVLNCNNNWFEQCNIRIKKKGKENFQNFKLPQTFSLN